MCVNNMMLTGKENFFSLVLILLQNFGIYFEDWGKNLKISRHYYNSNIDQILHLGFTLVAK